MHILPSFTLAFRDGLFFTKSLYNISFVDDFNHFILIFDRKDISVYRIVADT